MTDILPSTTPLLYQVCPLRRETLHREGRFFWQVEGQSMLPTLPANCTIEIHALDSGVKLGDLLVFAQPHAIVVHRLVERRGDRLILQGDNRTVPDAPITTQQVIGRVVSATYQNKKTYPDTFSQFVANIWIARYYWFKIFRILHRIVKDTYRR